MKIYKIPIWSKPSYEVYDVFNNGYFIRFLKDTKYNDRVYINKFKHIDDHRLIKLNSKETEDVPFINDSYFTDKGSMDNDMLTKALYFEIIKTKFHESS